MSNVGWDREAAQAMWLEGKSAGEIWRKVGAPSRNAVVGFIHRQGLKREWTCSVSPPKVKPARAPRAPKAVQTPTVYSSGRGSAATAKAPDLETIRKADAVPVDPATLKTFAELDRQQCLWPIGGPDPVRGQLFCGQPTAFRKSYCACHGGPQAAPRRPWRVKDLGIAAERPRTRSAADESDVIDLVEAFR